VDIDGEDKNEDNHEIPGVDANEDEENTDRTCGEMKLRSQPRREYNMFTTDGVEEEGITMLLFNEHDELVELDAEYLFLTETLGWGEETSTQTNAQSTQTNV
jgi:hypothetical protein